MPNTEINKRDHNYSEVVLLSPKSLSIQSAEKVTGQIKDIEELKKIAPRVRLQDSTSLNELKRISLSNKPVIADITKQELKKYCRTCAGLKIPLVKKILYY